MNGLLICSFTDLIFSKASNQCHDEHYERWVSIYNDSNIRYELANKAATRESCNWRSFQTFLAGECQTTLFIAVNYLWRRQWSLMTYIYFAQRRSFTYLYSARHNSDNEQTAISISYTTIRVSTMINDTEMSVTCDHIKLRSRWEQSVWCRETTITRV